MADFPDWTVPTGSGFVTVIEVDLTPNHGDTFPVVGVDSVLIHVEAADVNTAMAMQFQWIYEPHGATVINWQVVTGVPLVDDAIVLDFECPAYGRQLQILNNGGSAVNVKVLGSSRPARGGRILDDTNAGYPFNTTDPMVTDTEQILQSSVPPYNWYPSNARSGMLLQSDTNGAFAYRFIDFHRHPHDIPLATIVAGTPVYLEQALPQSIGVFVFTPSADNAGGVANVYAFPAQI